MIEKEDEAILGEVVLTPELQAAEEAADQEAYQLDCTAVEMFVEGGEDAKARKVAARWDGLPEIAERLIAARDAREARDTTALFDDVITGLDADKAGVVAKAPPIQPAPGPQVRGWAEVAPPSGANELEALTYVPGLVGDIVDWIAAGARRPNRMMALGAAVTVIGTLIGRSVQGPTGSATHLYIIILAPTGSGKDDPLRFGKALVKAVGAGSLIGPDEFASAPGFWNRLKRSPLLICFIDEMGDELAKINGQGGNEWVSQIFGTLKKCWNAWETINTAEKVHQESEEILWPAVSLVGAATPEKFFDGIKPGDIESGFVNRVLILPFEGHERAPERATQGDADKPPKRLIEALKRLPSQKVHTVSILDRPSNEVSRASGVAQPPKRFDPMPWGEGAEARYFAFSRALDKNAGTRRDELSRRGAENAVRLATILAVGRGSPSVDRQDIEWGIRFSARSMDAAAGGVEKYMKEYLAFPKFCERILAKINEYHGWRSESDLRREFRNNQKGIFDFNQAIEQLLKEGRIRAEERKPSRGPIAKGYASIGEVE
jgi:hypothetical protein